jgi:YD repeat-containing protein
MFKEKCFGTCSVTSFGFDELGRLTQKTSPGGQLTKFFYDQSDNVVREITTKGFVKEFTYDDKNQLVSKILPDDLSLLQMLHLQLAILILLFSEKILSRQFLLRHLIYLSRL